MAKKKKDPEEKDESFRRVNPDTGMSRERLRDAILESIEYGLNMMRKEEITPADSERLKAIKHVNTLINSGVALIQMEVAEERLMVIQQRMLQLGFYNLPEHARE